MPQSGPTCSRSAGTTSSAASIRSATCSGVSAPSSARSSTPTITVLCAIGSSTAGSSPGWAASIARMSAAQSGELGQERVAVGLVVDDRRVAEAGVQRGRARRRRAARGRSRAARTRAPSPRATAATARRSGRCRRRPRTGRATSSCDRDGEVHRELGLVGVVLVGGLLAHRERAGQRDLDRAVGARPQELQVLDLDRPRAPHRPDDRAARRSSRRPAPAPSRGCRCRTPRARSRSGSSSSRGGSRRR